MSERPRLERMTMEEATSELAWWGLVPTDADREQVFDDLLGTVAARAVDDPIAAETLRRIRKRTEASGPGRHRGQRRTVLARLKGLAVRA